MPVDDDARDRAERIERADYHARALQRREQEEAAQAQLLIDAFVAEALARDLPTVELAAKPWSGSGHYRTGRTGWYLKRDQSLAVGVDGGYYVLVVAPQRLARWRGVAVEPSPPPLQVGKGARDGESITLKELLALRLDWPPA